jgi:hypothetical protein
LSDALEHQALLTLFLGEGTRALTPFDLLPPDSLPEDAFLGLDVGLLARFDLFVERSLGRSRRASSPGRAAHQTHGDDPDQKASGSHHFAPFEMRQV